MTNSSGTGLMLATPRPILPCMCTCQSQVQTSKPSHCHSVHRLPPTHPTRFFHFVIVSVAYMGDVHHWKRCGCPPLMFNRTHFRVHPRGCGRKLIIISYDPNPPILQFVKPGILLHALYCAQS